MSAGWLDPVVARWADLLPALLIRDTVVLMAALIAMWLLREHAPHWRRRIGVIALVAVLLPVDLPGPGGSTASRVVAAMPASLPAIEAPAVPAPAGGSGIAWPLVVLAAWGGATLGATALVGARTLRLHRMMRCASEAPAAWSSGLSIPGRVRVRRARDRTGPLAAGLVRPVILLPSTFGTWPLAARRLALAHELSHVRRGDGFVQLLMAVVAIAHLAHPLVWVLLHRLRRDVEMACDEDARRTLGVSGAAYARGLLAIVDRTAPAVPSPALLVRGRGSEIAERVRSLLHRRRRGRGVALVPAAVLVLSGLVTAMVTAPATTRAIVDPRDGIVIGAAGTFLAARPVDGYPALGRGLVCPCSMEDHSVCPPGSVGTLDVGGKTLTVSAMIDADGAVVDVRVVRNGWPGWSPAPALHTLLASRWIPALRDGVPVRSERTLTFHPGNFEV